jgi:hypothetical protein
MSLVVATWAVAGVTLLLVVVAALTARFAVMAFRTQAEEVSDQKELIKQQSERLEIQRQHLQSDEDARQVDRVLSLHAEFSTGEIAAARCRFSELMWRAGETAFGLHTCWRPTWDSIYPPCPGCGEEINRSRFLGAYPPDMHARDHRPIHDLRKVLWCLGRVNVARRDEKESLREQLVVALLGWEVIWWSLVCERLERTHGAILQPLDNLASWVQEWNWMEDREFDPHRAFRETEAYQDKEAFLQELVSRTQLLTDHGLGPAVPASVRYRP